MSIVVFITVVTKTHQSEKAMEILKQRDTKMPSHAKKNGHNERTFLGNALAIIWHELFVFITRIKMVFMDPPFPVFVCGKADCA